MPMFWQGESITMPRVTAKAAAAIQRDNMADTKASDNTVMGGLGSTEPNGLLNQKTASVGQFIESDLATATAVGQLGCQSKIRKAVLIADRRTSWRSARSARCPHRYVRRRGAGLARLIVE